MVCGSRSTSPDLRLSRRAEGHGDDGGRLAVREVQPDTPELQPKVTTKQISGSEAVVWLAGIGRGALCIPGITSWRFRRKFSLEERVLTPLSGCIRLLPLWRRMIEMISGIREMPLHT